MIKEAGQYKFFVDSGNNLKQSKRIVKPESTYVQESNTKNKIREDRSWIKNIFPDSFYSMGQLSFISRDNKSTNFSFSRENSVVVWEDGTSTPTSAVNMRQMWNEAHLEAMEKSFDEHSANMEALDAKQRDKGKRGPAWF